MKLWYRRLPQYPDSLVLLADSAFKAEKDTGLSVRGMLAFRCSMDSCGVSGECAGVHTHNCTTTGTISGHLIEWVSRTQRHVTRATFSSELYGGTDAMDAGKLLQANLHELTAGPLPLDSLKGLEERGEFAVALVLVLDAMSVLSAIAAPQPAGIS